MAGRLTDGVTGDWVGLEVTGGLVGELVTGEAVTGAEVGLPVVGAGGCVGLAGGGATEVPPPHSQQASLATIPPLAKLPPCWPHLLP